MKRATVKVRTNPRKFGRATAERVPYIEVTGYACEVAGEPCVVHRAIEAEDGLPVPGTRYWVVTHAPSGGLIARSLMPDDTREAVLERARGMVERHGGREALLRVAGEVIEREGVIE